jgi:hypothetical protein
MVGVTDPYGQISRRDFPVHRKANNYSKHCYNIYGPTYYKLPYVLRKLLEG